MRQITIFEVPEHDVNIIFIYEDRMMKGMNYHHGVGNIDGSYFVNDQELFQRYLDKCVINDFNQCKVATEVVLERIEQNLLEEEITEAIKKGFEQIFDTDIIGMNISKMVLQPEEYKMLAEAEHKLIDAMKKVWIKRTK